MLKATRTGWAAESARVSNQAVREELAAIKTAQQEAWEKKASESGEISFYLNDRWVGSGHLVDDGFEADAWFCDGPLSVADKAAGIMYPSNRDILAMIRHAILGGRDTLHLFSKRITWRFLTALTEQDKAELEQGAKAWKIAQRLGDELLCAT